MKADGRLALAMRREILQCLRETQQIDRAGRLLGVGRQTLYNRLKAFGIVRSEWCGVEPEAGCGRVASSPPLLLKELADLLARYSSAAAAVAIPPDPLVLGEFHVPANGFPGSLPGSSRRESAHFNSDFDQSLLPSAATRMMGTALARCVQHRAGSIAGHEPTIDLFLRLGIDLRRRNLAKRRHGFWLRFETELDYLLVDARAAFLQKIKLAHPDCGGSAEEATNLSVAWNVIKRRFERRGIRL